MNDPRPAADGGPAGDAGPVDAARSPAEMPVGPGPDGATDLVFACPACGHAFASDTAAPSNGVLTCPACGAEFFAAADPTDEDRELAERMEADLRRREQALNGVRIRQVLTERRSLFRTRSYFVVLACLAVVAAVQLGIYSLQRLRTDGAGLRAAAYLAAAAGLLYAARACAGRVRLYTRELGRPALDEPTAEPDFSTLSDGSQRVAEAAANLERLSGRG